MGAAPPAQVLNDRYEVVRPLGHGGMGAVYLAFDRQEGRHVALKSFPPTARRVEDLAHFEAEFLTLSRLRHPHVAEVYDFGVIEGTSDVFFTSEVIAGKDLFEVSQGLPERELARLIVQVCRGLSYIHSREIIHYDVKPTNILVATGGPAPVAKLIDFGLAAQKVDDAIGVIKGTVSYLAPELARHLPVDHRADLYSLGVTLFHCLTRALPFRGETNLDVVRKVVSEPAPDPQEARPDLSRGLRELVLRLMAKDPGERPQSGNEVIRALSRIYGEDFATEPRHAAVTFVVSGAFVGRDEPFRRLTDTFEAIFAASASDEGPAVAPAAPDGPRKGSSGALATSGFVITSSAGSLDAALLDSAARFQSSYAPALDPADALDPGRAPPTPDPDAAPAPPAEARPLSHLVLVAGEAGVGKSRLLRELKTHAQLRRAAVVEGRATETGGAYSAFVEAFRGMLGLWPSDGPGDRNAPRQQDPLRRRLLSRYGAELVRLIPDLDSSAVPLGPRAALAPEQDEVRLLDALAQFLIGYGRSRPLVVLLHDLERADPASLELLRYVARNLAVIEQARGLAARVGAGRGPPREPPPPVRLLIVATYRPTEVEGRPQARALEALRAEPVVATLPLAPLGPADVRALIESMLGVGNAPAGLAERIWSETAGNPFFAVELMRSLVEAGALVREDGRWRLVRPDAVRVPDRVAEVILERARRIGDDERAPLELLAVLGRPAGVPELQALLGGDARDLVTRLAGLERRQVLRADEGHAGGQRRWEFVHDVARAAVYEAIPAGRRIDLHARCGELLEQRAALGTVDTGELVRHFAAAGDRRRALTYGIRAGDDARAVHANHRAIAFYEGALALLPAGASRWREILAATGDLLEHTGDYDRAAAIYARLLAPDVARGLTPEEAVRAHRRRGEVLERKGDFDGALDALSDGAATALATDGLEREGAALLAATASIYGRTGRYADALGFCEAALAQLAGLPEGEATAQVHAIRGRARSALGDMAAAERDLEQALAIRRRLGDEAGVARALADLGLVALETGRLEDAANRFERALERETALGHAAGIAEAASRLAQACRGLGELERAASLLRRALSIHEKSGARAEAVSTLTELGRLSAATDPAGALDALRRARAGALQHGLLAVAARAHNAEAALLLRLGHEGQAQELATEALRLASLHGDVPRERAAALENLGLAHAARGDADHGEHLLHEAQALFRAQGDPAGVARTTLAVVELLLARGDAALARAALEGLEQAPPPADERARHLLVRARAALTVDPPAGAAARADERALADLERAGELAEAAHDRELAWQVDWVRGRTLERAGDLQGALAALVEAMSALRDLMERVPAELRGAYVRAPARVACRSDFLRLKGRAAAST